jgi:hypothetical protein
LSDARSEANNHEITCLRKYARLGWLILLTAARSGERWQLLEVGDVYP